MELIDVFGKDLLPIFLIAGLGWAFAARKEISARTLSQVGFYLLAPCLIFTLISHSRISAGDFLRLSAFSLATYGITGGLALWVAQMLGLSRSLKAAILLCVLLPNSGSFGMSASLFSFGPEAETRAGLIFVTMSILAYSVGVVVASMGKAKFSTALRRLLSVPAIWAVPAAFLLRASGSPLPVPLRRTIELLSDATIPVFLLILGMQLRKASPRHHPKALCTALVFRLIGGMGVGLLLAPLFKLEGASYQAGVLEMAMPSAVVCTILATEYDTEPSFVATAVFCTMLASPLTLTPLLHFLGV
jgi:predicted permease